MPTVKSLLSALFPGLAEDPQSVHEQQLSIANEPVHIRYSNTRLADSFSPPLAHLSSKDAQATPFQILVTSADELAIQEEGLAKLLALAKVRNDTERMHSYLVHDDSAKLCLQFSDSVHSIEYYETAAAFGLYWRNTASGLEARADSEYFTSPLRTLFAWHFAGRGKCMIHGAGVGTAEAGGLLLVGPGGSGKSSTALSMLAHLGFAGDDSVLLERGLPPQIHCLYASARLYDEDIPRYPRLASARVVRSENEKSRIYFYPDLDDALVHQFALKAIICVKQEERHTSLKPIRFIEGLKHFAPNSLLHIPGLEQEYLSLLTEATKNTAWYELQLGHERPQLQSLLFALLQTEPANGSRRR